MREKPGLAKLRAAREVIADEKHWTKGGLARTAEGLGCSAGSPEAVCWCAEGAIRKAGGGYEELYALKRAIGSDKDLARRGLYYWQDKPERTHAEVLAAFDAAIAEEVANG